MSGGWNIASCLISLSSFLLFFGYVSFKKFWFKKYIWKFFRRKEITASEFKAFVFALSSALFKFSKKHVGALIVIEKFQNLQKYINTGYVIETKFFAEFLYNIFQNKESSMHDGGVIIRGLEIKSVSSYFPIFSHKNIPNEYGSRHRAALGITSQTDAVALLVSESSGKILCSEGGKFQELNKHELESIIQTLTKVLNYYIE
ncbi:hypothetical protein WEN_02065 [Mycoplasma wenyonii str. Massachusetts]|uniref:Diadenylate cyclase n=1 Tax=Mycoplasma wenyonii (strain Massachusetts) TaxID=1197325 RepID=I6ZF10_MYCWM|nr:diadenylate cyclase CdaM [Mycoplasma wenyonii]AFN65202.1 hypothetical protein WEN_02065 [Mycoplasma wenyonii str. Massachusetts]